MTASDVPSSSRAYTLTTWHVKAGMEEEFVTRWSEWIDWSHLQGLGAHAILLRDIERPETFISFGPWESIEAVRHWRFLPGYDERVARLHDVLESFEPTTLEVLARR